jgi:hypothetical protein
MMLALVAIELQIRPAITRDYWLAASRIDAKWYECSRGQIAGRRYAFAPRGTAPHFSRAAEPQGRLEVHVESPDVQE